MTARAVHTFLESRANNPLPEPQPPTWTLMSGAPRAPGIGHNGGPSLDGMPVNTGVAPSAGPRGFAPAKSDCPQPDTGAASDPDSI